MASDSHLPPDVEPIDLPTVPLPRREGGLYFAYWLSGLAAGALIGLAASVLPLRAETVDGNRIIVIDGDTVALPCARPARGCAEKLRLYAIDAPESFRPRCDAEEIAGLEAKARLAELLRGQPVEVQRGEPGTGRQHDVYGRTLGALVTPAGDVATILLREELALPWHPGHAAHDARLRTWCGRQ